MANECRHQFPPGYGDQPHRMPTKGLPKGGWTDKGWCTLLRKIKLLNRMDLDYSIA